MTSPTDKIQKVLFDNQECLWLPFYKDGLPVLGRGAFICRKVDEDRETYGIRIISASNKDRDSQWFWFSRDVVVAMMALLAEGLQEFGDES